jgi:CRISPR system Cascade subunit CasC
MRLIELHILQSFPVSCLNRDEVGAPKTAVFGGVTRARISSQCLKRAIRLMARDLQPALFAGERTKLLIEPLARRLRDGGLGQDFAVKVARDVGSYLATLDDKAAAKGVEKVKTLMFFSPGELDAIAASLRAAAPSQADDAEQGQKKGKGKKKGAGDIAKVIEQACRRAALKDAADVAIFGRMVASDHSLTVEGAGLFGHALSTHKVAPELDFFTAVDDRQKEDPTIEEEDRAGSGMMGTLEFTSAVYYRYVGLNLDLLFYQGAKEGRPTANLAALLGDEHAQARKDIVTAFLRSAIMAVPGARKNSMNADTDVGYALGTAKNQGQPMQLVNAFEEAVWTRNGWIAPSAKAMLLHLRRVKAFANPEHIVEVATGTHSPAGDDELRKELIPRQVDLDTFCAELVKHVI